MSQRMKPGTEIYIDGHPSILNNCNAVVLDDGGDEVWFITLHGNGNNLDGIRGVLPREFIREGLRPRVGERPCGWGEVPVSYGAIAGVSS